MHNNIHFYGERGIVNAIILDIYQKRSKVKDSLNRFFGEIKLMDNTVNANGCHSTLVFSSTPNPQVRLDIAEMLVTAFEKRRRIN